MIEKNLFKEKKKFSLLPIYKCCFNIYNMHVLISVHLLVHVLDFTRKKHISGWYFTNSIHWLSFSTLSYGQLVIELNSDVTAADNSFFTCRYDVISTDNSLLVIL